MPRQREFDNEKVLEKAMLLFWAQGYESTSVRDLNAAMGISSSTMYEFFGDKRAIFLAALARYCGIEQGRVAQIAAAAPSPQVFIENLFASVNDVVLVEAGIQGSFAFNTMVEFGTRDPDVTAQLLDHFYKIGDIIAALIEAAQASGIVTSRAAPLDLAHTILTTLQGVVTVVGVKADYPYRTPITRLLIELLSR
ncbi:MAG: TetR/AcrR family transcriptional regulator [Chloroflexota bacterium]